MAQVQRQLATHPALVLQQQQQPGTNSGHSALQVAVEYVRAWMWDTTVKTPGRFCLYLDATSEETLRASYYQAMRRVMFCHDNDDLMMIDEQELNGMEIQAVADRLLVILERKGELCGHQWILLFANVQPLDRFHAKFFSAKSNWWNPGRGKFLLVASTMHQVCVDQGSHGHLLPLDAVPVFSNNKAYSGFGDDDEDNLDDPKSRQD